MFEKIDLNRKHYEDQYLRGDKPIKVNRSDIIMGEKTVNKSRLRVGTLPIDGTEPTDSLQK